MVDVSRSVARAPGGERRWFRVAVPLVSALFGFLAGELMVRVLGSDEKRWEWRNFITEPLTTANRWQIIQPDRELGYVPRPGARGDQGGLGPVTFDEHGLRVHRAGIAPSRPDAPPVLVVGNSYAMGEEVGDEETIPAHLQDMLGRRVLNGGVFGYGLDQIVLRAERLVPMFSPDLLVVTFIADDIRRTRMSVLWGVPKPYFEVVDGALALRNVPVPPLLDPSLDPVRAVLGYSFLIDVVMRRLNMVAWWLRGQPLHTEAAHDQGERVSCLLMERLGRLADRHRMRVLVVAQYTPHAWQADSTLGFEVGGIVPLLDCARDQDLQVIDTRRMLDQVVRRDGFERYYEGKHMSDAGNRLTARTIAGSL